MPSQNYQNGKHRYRIEIARRLFQRRKITNTPAIRGGVPFQTPLWQFLNSFRASRNDTAGGSPARPADHSYSAEGILPSEKYPAVNTTARAEKLEANV